MAWNPVGNLKGPQGDPGDDANVAAHEAAADPHPQYATDADLTNGLASKAASVHTHDDRYFTETEVNTLLSGKSDTSHDHDSRYYTETEVDTALSGKAASVHTHDDRYFTETEVNTALSGKANTSHAHTTADVTGLDTALSGKAAASHTHGVSDLTATGTRNGTTVLHGDNTWKTPSGSGVSDHGALTGLADDDHPHYHTDARGDARYHKKSDTVAVVTGNPAAISVQQTGDAGPSLEVTPDGAILMGPGDGSFDSGISRTAADQITVDGQVIADRLTASPTNFFDIAQAAKADGDAHNRHEVFGDGYTKWGSGAAPPDTFLYKDGVTKLRTNGQFQVDGNETVLGTQSVTGTITAGAIINNGDLSQNGALVGTGIGVPLLKGLSAAITTTSTAGANATGMSVSVVANGRYALEFCFIYSTSATTIDPIFGWTGPNGGYWSLNNTLGTNTADTGPYSPVVSSIATALTAQGSVTANQNRMIYSAGSFTVAGANTTLQLRFWLSAAGTLTLREGSWLRVTRIA